MAGHAKSKLVKKYDLSRKKHNLLLVAAKRYADEQEKPKEVRQGAQRIARKVTDEYQAETGVRISVCYSTVLHIHKGGERLYEFNKSKAWLNQIEEDRVVDFLVHTAAHGFPLTHHRLKEIVDSIIRKRVPDFKGVGKCYTGCLLARNAHCISAYWGNPLEQCHAQAVNPTTVHAWFDLVQSLMIKHSIQWINIWGADETGIALGGGGVERVLGGVGQKGQHRSCSGARENVTVMVTIGVCKRSIPPFVVFKGQAFAVKWLHNNPVNATLSYSKKGWMTGEVSIEWLKHYDKHTSVQAGDSVRLLLVDGHSSHYPLELLDYARDHKIEIVCYPSHTTHVLQGLDVACFARLKQLYTQYAREYEDSTKLSVTKEVFLTPFSQAYVETFTSDTIESAFRVTGIHPFNPDAIPAIAMAPSLPTSTRSALPIELPDAVAAIARLWDMDPEELTGEGDDDGNDGDVGHDGSNNSDNGDDSRSQSWEIERESEENMGGLEPEPETSTPEDDETVAPCAGNEAMPERHRSSSPEPAGARTNNRLNIVLANTSAAFLVDNSPVTSNERLEPLPFHHIPSAPRQLSIPPSLGEPTTALERHLFERLQIYHSRDKEREAAYRGSQAQLVLVDRHCGQLQSQLQAKEDRARKRKTGEGTGRLLGDGMPRALCDGEFYNAVKQLRENAVAQEEAKRNKAAESARVKELREVWSKEEEARKRINAEAYRRWKEGPLQAWEAARDQAKAAGRRLRGYPRPKPPAKLKPLPQPWKQQQQQQRIEDGGEDGVAVGNEIGEEGEETDEESDANSDDSSE